jgi:hypothetical protein
MQIEHTINEGAFESEVQLHNYVDALENGVLPLKFAYIGAAAYTHDKLARSKEYGLVDTETNLITSQLASLVAKQCRGGSLGVFDVGSGNGLKGCHVIHALSRHFHVDYYVALDYSNTLLSIASHNLATCAADLKLQLRQVDFEEWPFGNDVSLSRDCKTDVTTLYLLLGNTIGNPFNRRRTISNLRLSMDLGDLLIVGFELYHEAREAEMLSQYRNQPFYDAVFTPLTFAGLQPTDGDLSVDFNHDTKSVEVRFTIHQDTRIWYALGNHLDLLGGKPLLIFTSHRFDLDELISACGQGGFSTEAHVLDPASKYCLALLKAIDQGL